MLVLKLYFWSEVSFYRTRCKKKKTPAWFEESKIYHLNLTLDSWLAPNAQMKERFDVWRWTVAAPPVLTAVWPSREGVMGCFQTVSSCHHLQIRQPSLLRMWGRGLGRRAAEDQKISDEISTSVLQSSKIRSYNLQIKPKTKIKIKAAACGSLWSPWQLHTPWQKTRRADKLKNKPQKTSRSAKTRSLIQTLEEWAAENSWSHIHFYVFMTS